MLKEIVNSDLFNAAVMIGIFIFVCWVGFKKTEEKGEVIMIDMNEYDKVMADCRSISVAKSKDYGTGNLTKHGVHGIVIRMSDKQARLENLLSIIQQDPNAGPAVDESIEDTAKDMVNYAVYLVLMMNGKITQ